MCAEEGEGRVCADLPEVKSSFGRVLLESDLPALAWDKNGP